MIADLDPAAAPLIAFHRPLVDVWTAASALARSTERIIALAEAGELRWAFDLASKGSRNRVIRILASCISDYQQRRKPQREWERVFSQIIPLAPPVPGAVATIRACEVMACFSLGEGQAARFISGGLLEVAKPALAKSGPYGSPRVTVASVEALLKSRRIA